MNVIANISTSRSDDQLESGLYETANWTVNGVQGVVLCEVASLRLAIEKAGQFAAMGREVVALMRRRPPEIVVLPAQVRKLTNLLPASQVASGSRVAVFTIETADNSNGSLPRLKPNGAVHRAAAASGVT
jgi:hypothetical protein